MACITGFYLKQTDCTSVWTSTPSQTMHLKTPTSCQVSSLSLSLSHSKFRLMRRAKLTVCLLAIYLTQHLIRQSQSFWGSNYDSFLYQMTQNPCFKVSWALANTIIYSTVIDNEQLRCSTTVLDVNCFPCFLLIRHLEFFVN
jgi:hypothetical protein